MTAVSLFEGISAGLAFFSLVMVLIKSSAETLLVQFLSSIVLAGVLLAHGQIFPAVTALLFSMSFLVKFARAL